MDTMKDSENLEIGKAKTVMPAPKNLNPLGTLLMQNLTKTNVP